MTALQKNSIIILFFLAFVSSLAITFYFIEQNNSLEKQLTSRQKIIKKFINNDSLDCSKTTEYKTVIEKYITKDCGLIINGKEISLEEFVEIYNLEQNQNLNQMKEFINTIKNYEKDLEKMNQLEDSIFIINAQYNLLKSRLGIKLNSKQDKDVVTIGYESKKIDSALILLNYFRHKLKYDTVKKNWIIIN